jgi:hypothetical protein
MSTYSEIVPYKEYRLTVRCPQQRSPNYTQSRSQEEHLQLPLLGSHYYDHLATPVLPERRVSAFLSSQYSVR